MSRRSSTSGAAVTDLSAKYNRLATEYASAKAQLQVLKTAVQEEKSQTEQLTESLKAKDQTIRRLNQEIEALSFRNQQLSKRVQQFQESGGKGDGSSSAGSLHKHDKGKHKAAAVAADNNRYDVLAEELQSKLQETERLHLKLHQLETAHNLENERLTSEHATLTSENRKLLSQIDELNASQQLTINILQREKESLAAALTALQQEMKIKEKRYQLEQRSFVAKPEAEGISVASAAVSSNKTKSDGLSSPSEHASDSERKVSVSANRSRAASSVPSAAVPTSPALAATHSLDLPVIDSLQLAQVGKVFADLHESSSVAINNLENFFSYNEQRTKIYQRDIHFGATKPETGEKLLQVYANGSISLKDLSKSCASLFSHESSIIDISWDDALAVISSFVKFGHFIKSAIPVIALSIEEECGLSWCNERLEQENRQYYRTFRSFCDTLIQLQEFLMNAKFSDALKTKDHAKIKSLFDNVISSLEQIYTEADECYAAYRVKSAIENQLPMANKQLKTTNECIIACFNGMVISFRKLKDNLARHSDVLVDHFTSSIGANVAEFRQFRVAASAYMNRLEQYAVSHSAETQKKPTAIISGVKQPSDKTLDEIIRKNKQIAELEKEKEHWALECQLLRMKYANRNSAHEDLNANGSVASSSNRTSGFFDSSSAKTSAPNSAGNSPTSNSNDRKSQNRSSDDAEFTEEYFLEKLFSMRQSQQLADSKIQYLQQECQTLLRSMQVYLRNEEKLQKELRESHRNADSLKDDLQTTKTGYETQLATMSELLASLNQTIATQTEALDAMKQHATATNHKVKTGKKKFGS